MNFMKRFFSKPFYPFLLVAYFFLHIYAANIHEHPPLADILLLFSACLAATTAVFFVLRLVFRNSHPSGFLTAALVFLFFTYGFIAMVLTDRLGLPGYIPGILYGVLLAAVVLFVVRTRKRVLYANSYFNILALVLVSMPLLSMAAYVLKGRSYQEVPRADSLPEVREDASKPDIYYIILDEYPRNDELKRVFNYDNRDFSEYLVERGFYIAEKSRCNYIRTRLSLPSSLNMQYLDFVTERMKGSTDTGLVDAMVKANNVARMLKQIGYQYVVFDSGASPSDRSPLADFNISYSPIAVREMHVLMAKTTILQSTKKKFLREQFRKRHLFNFEHLAKIPEMKGPQFVFAHMVIPHLPFVFDREGNMPEVGDLEYSPHEDGRLKPEYHGLFIDQLVYLNKMVKELIDKILRQSENPPIIILQADTGSWPVTEWAPTEEFLRERLPIFNAYLVPEEVRKGLYPEITPVNTFRLIFGRLFGADFPLLEDKSYYSHPTESPFQFTEVTESGERKQKTSPRILV